MMCKVLTVLLVLVLAAGSAQADVGIQWVKSPDPGGNTPAGYTAWDLMVTTATNLAVQELYIAADTAGDIYQNDSLGSQPELEPNPAGFPGDPQLEFDTYVTIGAWPYATPTSIIGGAVDIVGSGPGVMTNQNINLAWAPKDVPPGPLTGPGNFQVARVTTKDNAWMTWQYWGKETNQEFATTASGSIPEPTTLLLLVGPALAVLLRRR